MRRADALYLWRCANQQSASRPVRARFADPQGGRRGVAGRECHTLLHGGQTPAPQLGPTPHSCRITIHICSRTYHPAPAADGSPWGQELRHRAVPTPCARGTQRCTRRGPLLPHMLGAERARSLLGACEVGQIMPPAQPCTPRNRACRATVHAAHAARTPRCTYARAPTAGIRTCRTRSRPPQACWESGVILQTSHFAPT